MKIIELKNSVSIMLSNEENKLFDKIKDFQAQEVLNPRDKFVCESLIKKGLVSKIHLNGQTILIKYE
jgi:hypothetical protein